MMATQKHMGRNSLVKRLTAQTGSAALAKNLLKQRGHMNEDGSLSKKGRERDRMTAGERAKDRAASERGGSPRDYRFNPKTNTARRK